MTDKLDLCAMESGTLRFACALAQINGVMPWPASTTARLSWPPRADGVLGSMSGAVAHTKTRVVYPPVRWGGASDVQGDRPAMLLILQGGQTALAIHRYAFGSWPVIPATAVLHNRGIYAVALHPEGDTPVLDFAYLGALL